MNSSKEQTLFSLVLVLAVMLFSLAANMSAQVQTETSTTAGQPTHEVTVEHGEVVLVQGDDLLVKMEDGSIKHFANLPESARALVDGKSLGIHDLKPGMKLERTITVTTTPRTITTVQTVTGKVWHITPPNSVILTLEDGSNQQFKIPQGQKFTVDGQETDAWGLKKGMKVTATKVVEVPENVITRQKQVTGSAPPPPSPPPADAPILVAASGPPPLPRAAAPATELPHTGSLLPLLGILGAISLLFSMTIGVFRRVV